MASASTRAPRKRIPTPSTSAGFSSVFCNESSGHELENGVQTSDFSSDRETSSQGPGTYIYEPVVGEGKRPVKLVLGAAVAFCFTWAWHSMVKGDAIWCSLSVLGIALEVLVTEIRKCQAIRKLEGRYLASAHRMRVATAVLGAPHFLLTICACLFHLGDLETILVICRKTVTGFPFPLLPVLAVLYCACHAAIDAEEWETSAAAKRKQASS